MAGTVKARSLFDTTIVRQAIVDSFRKLTPRRQVRNPVMFVVYVGSILTTLLWVQALVGKGEAPGWFIFWVSVWLWFTVLFANFAEAMADRRLRCARRGAISRPSDWRGPSAPHGTSSSRPRACERASSCSWKPATSSRPTGPSSRASPR